jgi:hypothetical protein
MAEQGFLQRGLSGMRDGMRSAGRQIGQSAKKAANKAKASLGIVKKQLGFSDVDAYNDDVGEQDRRRRSRALLGNGDEPEFLGIAQQDPKRDLATVAPEYRAQVSSGLAAANSLTTGSTTVGKKASAENNRY